MLFYTHKSIIINFPFFGFVILSVFDVFFNLITKKGQKRKKITIH
jgi:hypothetical protein